ncbi:sigma-70 family RNA polymerase sigma factor [Thermoleophilia bacterium SCSIO 60948]|nr:sigma-70 family RNA polymerase sigma factor [Thermoleophilia bacterium SCSIO 60948]
MAGAERDEVERVFRAEHGRAVSVLAGRFGIELAEDGVGEAYRIALERWPREGVPPDPVGWMVTTARNRAIDHLRRESSRAERQAAAAVLTAPAEAEAEIEDDPVGDERLRLIFTCCHPALAPASRVALTLRLLGGLTTAEIAAAFLSTEQAMGQRLSRAKAKIRDAGIPYRIPREADLPERLSGVLSAVYLIFNEGYAASSGERLIRPDLCREAIRLARTLADLMPDESEVRGLMALMLLTEARRPARLSASGDLVPLADQDRALWDRELLTEGGLIVRRLIAGGSAGPYAIQAAIAAVHSDPSGAASADWRQIVRLYDQLLAFEPGPVAELNRAVAVAEVEGPEAGLDLLDRIELGGHRPFAVRAELLRRCGRDLDALGAYDRAIELAANDTERRHLERRRAELRTT